MINFLCLQDDYLAEKLSQKQNFYINWAGNASFNNRITNETPFEVPIFAFEVKYIQDSILK